MGPSREACDRCHAMKTRCVRVPRSQICVRCNRLNIPCNYSPPGRTGRPLGSGKGRHSKRAARSDTASSIGRSPSIVGSEEGCSISGPCPPNLEDFNFFDTRSGSDEDSISMFLMGNLLADDGNQFTTASTVSTSPEARSLSTPRSGSEASSIMYYPPDPAPTSYAAPELCHEASSAPSPMSYMDGGQLSHIMDMQTRLTRRLNALQSGSYAPDDIEDTYRVSEELIGILDNVGNSPQFPSMVWTGSPRPNGIAMLLLSSCYFSLIHAYEILVDIFRRELRGSFSGESSMPTHCLPQITPGGGAPSISVGTVRVAMPRRAIAEVNLHLVAQSVQHLKASMERFAARMANAQASSPEAQQSIWSSMQSFEAGCSTVTDLAKTALGELQQREENLFAGLRTKAY